MVLYAHATPNKHHRRSERGGVQRRPGPHRAVGGEKNPPAAVALGRLGGLKGGKARAEKLSAKKRSAIAKKGARARWNARKG